MVLNSKVECRASAIAGLGLYAIAPIAKGEMIWEPEPDEKDTWYTLDQIKSWPRDVQEHFLNVAYQVKDGVFSGILPGRASDKAEYTNHSCAPTSEFEGDDRTIATRDIAVGEEITYDYGTSETLNTTHPPFKCCCGTSACRGIVSGYDCLLPEVRSTYAGKFTETALDFQSKWDAEHGAASEAAARAEIAGIKAALDAGVKLQSAIEKIVFGDASVAATA